MASRSRFAEPTHFSGLRGCFDIEVIMPIWTYGVNANGENLYGHEPRESEASAGGRQISRTLLKVFQCQSTLAQARNGPANAKPGLVSRIHMLGVRFRALSWKT